MEHKALVIGVVSVIIIFLDQLTKVLIENSLGNTIMVLPNFLSIVYTTNSGSIFGILQGHSGLLIWFSIVVLGVILYYYEDIPAGRVPYSLVGLIVGGIIGNLIDRIRLGHVIDFINVPFFSTFNIADSALTIGILGLVIYLYRADKR